VKKEGSEGRWKARKHKVTVVIKKKNSEAVSFAPL
jgi:hypothetical protein